MTQLKPLRPLLRLLKLNQKPCKIPLPPAELFPSSELVKEENAPRYNPRHFYPVRLHEILNDRYQVMSKLGWGMTSTVWFAMDLDECVPPPAPALQLSR